MVSTVKNPKTKVKKSGVTLVFKYGLLAPSAHADYVRNQIYLAHKYRNKLIEIAKNRRSEQRSVDSSDPALASLESAKKDAEARLNEIASSIASIRSKTNSRSESADLKAALKAAREERKKAVIAWKKKRAEYMEDPNRISMYKTVKSMSAKCAKQARSENGLHWGTGCLVDEAMSASAKMPLYDMYGNPNDPKFVRWTGEGRVGIQVHQYGKNGDGLSIEEIMSGVGWVAIGNLPPRPIRPARNEKIARARAANAARRAAALAEGRGSESQLVELRMRIGTAEDKTPIIACWPMNMHRPLPPNAIVRRVAVSLKRIGPREIWTCEFTINIPNKPTKPAAPIGSGAVAIDIGWLSVDRGLRVASCLDESGHAWEACVLGNSIHPSNRGCAEPVAAFRQAYSIDGIIDNERNLAIKSLVSYLRENGVPTWIRDMTVKKGQPTPSEVQALAYLSSWKSSARLAVLALRWRTNRWEGDEKAFSDLEQWRYHDRHLWVWAASLRIKAVRRRRQEYRKFAAELASKYELIIMNNVSYKDLARKSNPEDPPDIKLANSNRQIAAPGELRSIIRSEFAARGGKVKDDIEAKNLSITCPACGSLCSEQRHDHKHEMICSKCTFMRDLDVTMMMNLFKEAGYSEKVYGMIERGKKFAEQLKKGSFNETA